MPKKLKAFPGVLELQEYNKKVDQFFSPVFDENIWEFSDQEIQDLRTVLGLRAARTRDTYISWFIHDAKEAAERVNMSLKVKRAHNGVVLQAVDEGDRR